MSRFSAPINLDRNLIYLDPSRFQGRQGEYSEDTVNAIVTKGSYDRTAEPVVVWQDPADNKYYIISGHSRWEASRRLFESGKQPDLATMPVKMYLGDEDDAIDYATIESNRGSTEEGLQSDLAAYRRAVERGWNKDRLLSAFKPESRLRKLRLLSYLDPKGQFLQYLGSTGEFHFPYIERNARWVGEMRDQLPLTDFHEQEIFDWYYKGNQEGQKYSRDQFFKIINDKVARIDFDPTAPLNLKNRVSSSALTDPITEQIRQIDAEIEKLRSEETRKRNSIAQARTEGIDEVIPALNERISEINRVILKKLQEKNDLKQAAGYLERTSLDLFSQMDAAPAPVKAKEPEVAPAPTASAVKIRNKKQAEINDKIREMIKAKTEKNETYSLDEIEFIQLYAGSGGVSSGNRGMLYEYYTPLDICARMWAMVYRNGFTTGDVLEPSVGIGNFLRFVDPSNVSVDAYEMNPDDPTGYNICAASYPWASVKYDYFESIFYTNNKRTGTEKRYDVVIGNPPYGSFTGTYAGKKREGKLFNGTTYDQYFIWAGINLLKPGGQLCMIVPSTFMDNSSNHNKIKDEIYAMADLIEAYRMPRGIFKHTDIGTDILLFKKRA
jgi:hypothetical protein